jgi:hypothetical protein
MGRIDAAAIRVGFLSASLLAPGCVSDRQAYPKAWTSIETPVGQTCSQIANTYRNWGERAPDVYGSTPGRPSPEALTHVLFGDLANQRQADRVAFSFPQAGQLQLVVSGSSGQLSSVVLTSESGKFSCRKGIVIMRQGARWSLPAPPAAGATRTVTTFELYPLDDYLVVAEQEHGFVLLAFVLPIRDRRTSWFRFERTGLEQGASGSRRDRRHASDVRGERVGVTWGN